MIQQARGVGRRLPRVGPEFRSYKYRIQCYARPMTTVPLTEAKARLNELVDEAVRTHERVTITRHGRPAVVLLSVEDLETMEETLFWQAQSGLSADVAQGREEIAAGALSDEAEIRRRYGVGSAR